MKRPYLIFWVMLLLSSVTSSIKAADLTTLQKFESLKQDEILEGRSDGNPELSANLTRAEMATILFRMYHLEPITDPVTFTDSSNHWAEASGYLEAVKQAELMNGTGASSFSPDEYVTKEQLAAIMLNSLKLKPTSDAATSNGKFSPWAKDILATALKEQLISVSDDYTTYTTRGEAIYDLYPVYQKIKAATTYNLELSRWNIYNDGTHPIETTEGLNQALQWAHQQGYTTFKVPAGTYLIAKGSKSFDPEARIEMVDNMTFWLDDQAVIQKETNGFEGYETIRIGPEVRNATLRGGTYRGDKDTHDYSSKASGGTHEGGIGIHSQGSVNLTINGVKAIDFTGDALGIGAEGKQIAVLTESDFESGSVDDSGQLINDPESIRTKTVKTKLDHPFFQTSKSMMFSNPLNINRHVTFDIYFYKSDDTLLSSVKNQEIDWSYVNVPDGATYYRAVFHTATYAGIRLEFWNRDLSKNTVVQNSEFAFSRRQGITVGGAEGTLIINNNIHNIKGTAPQSGIDLEGGIGANGHLNRNIMIKNNHFQDNAAYNVILYDGEYATVEGNYLGPNADKSSVGVAVSTLFRKGTLIKDNVFDGSKIAAGQEIAFVGNEMKDSVASIVGKNITIDGMTFTDASLKVSSEVSNGIQVSNVTMNNTKRQGTALIVEGEPSHFTNVTINGESSLAGITGNVADGSIFDNLKIIGYGNGLNLPRGTYTNCEFEAGSDSGPPPMISKSGKYVFDGCTMTGRKSPALKIADDQADVTVNNSKLNVSGPFFGNNGVIVAEKANSVNLVNNSLTTMDLTQPYVAVIKINNYDAVKNPAYVLNAVIKGNTITSNISTAGISTTDSGSSAPAYTIEDNTLYNAKLELKANDISSGNKELSR